jgi:hypothetical protein
MVRGTVPPATKSESRPTSSNSPMARRTCDASTASRSTINESRLGPKVSHGRGRACAMEQCGGGSGGQGNAQRASTRGSTCGVSVVFTLSHASPCPSFTSTGGFELYGLNAESAAYALPYTPYAFQMLVALYVLP